MGREDTGASMRTLRLQNTFMFKFIEICHNWASCDVFGRTQQDLLRS